MGFKVLLFQTMSGHHSWCARPKDDYGHLTLLCQDGLGTALMAFSYSLFHYYILLNGWINLLYIVCNFTKYQMCCKFYQEFQIDYLW